MSSLILLFLIFGNAVTALGQVSNYVFTESTNETYTEITGGSTLVAPGITFSNAVSSSIPLDFSFNFNGSNKTSVFIAENGFITFDVAPTSSNSALPISSTDSYSGAIACYGANLHNAGAMATYKIAGVLSEVRYKTLGVAPNRVFVVQYKNVIRRTGTTSFTNRDGLMNMQIRIYEGTNIIETWYKNGFISTNKTSVSGQVGLRGALNTDFNNRQNLIGTPVWSPSASGLVNTSCLNTSSTLYNNSVVKFTFTPPCFSPFSITASLREDNTSAIVTWDNPSIPPVGYLYEVRTNGEFGSGNSGLYLSDSIDRAPSALDPILISGLTLGTYSIYAKSSCGGAVVSTTVTSICPTIKPTFSIIASICYGSVLEALPTTSLNNISGTWSPALNNLATTEYTFTPTTGQCAFTFKKTIEVITTPTPTAAVNQTFCNSAKTSDLVVTGENIKWYDSEIGGSNLSANTNLTDGQVVYVSQTLNGCESNRIQIIVGIKINDSQITTNLSTVCEGSTIEIKVISSAINASYLWSTGEHTDTINPTLTKSTTYWVDEISQGASCRKEITINVTPNAVPTFDKVDPICVGTFLETLATTSTNDISGTWSPALNNLATTEYTFTPTTGECAFTFKKTIEVINTPKPIATATQTFCNSAKISDLVVTGENIKWYDSEIGGSILLATNNLTNGQVVYVSQTLNGCESQRIQVTVGININDSQINTNLLTVCAGSSIEINCISSLLNASYLWSTGENTATIKPTLTTNTSYWVDLISQGISCRKSITIDVLPNLTPVFSNVSPICNGDSFPILPTISNNGISGTWSPELNNTNTTTYTFTPTKGVCAVPFSQTNIVINTPKPLGNTTQTFCNRATISDLVVTGENIKWYDSENGGNPIDPSTELTSETTYFASQTSENCESMDRLEVVVIIQQVSYPTEVSASSATISCGETTNLTATSIGNTIRWYDSEIGGTLLATSQSGANLNVSPLATKTYYAESYNGTCASPERVAVTITVATPAEPTEVSASKASISCGDNTNLTAISISNSIRWYDSEIGGALLATSQSGANLNVSPLATKTYYAESYNGTCASPERVAVTITVVLPTKPTIVSASKATISCGETTNLTATSIGNTIRWYDSEIGGTLLATSQSDTNFNVAPLVTTTYFAESYNGTCANPMRVAVTVTFVLPAKPTAVSATEPAILWGATTNLTATSINNTIRWYDADVQGTLLATSQSGANFNVAPLITTTYFAESYNGTCANPMRVAVTINVGAPAEPIVLSPIHYCKGAVATPLTATSFSGYILKWYATATSDSPLSEAPTPPTNKILTMTYYVSQVNVTGGVESPRVPIIVKVDPVPTTPAFINLKNTNGKEIIDKAKVSPYIGTTTPITLYTFSKNAKSYEWKLPKGVVITSEVNSITIDDEGISTVNASSELEINFAEVSAGPKTLSIAVKSVGECEVSPEKKIDLKIILPSSPKTISTTNSKVCFGIVGTSNKVTYSIDPVDGALYDGYIWTVPSGTKIETPFANPLTMTYGTSIEVSYSRSFASGAVTVKASNNIGLSKTKTLTVVRKVPYAISTITGPTTFCASDTATITIPSIEGVSYSWSTNYGTSIIADGANAIASFANTGSNINSVSIIVSQYNACGYGTSKKLTLIRASCDTSKIASKTASPSQSFKAKVYPNPSSTAFEVTTSTEKAFSVKVYDLLGKLIEEQHSEDTTMKIGESYPSGTYTIIVSQDKNLKSLQVIKR